MFIRSSLKSCFVAASISSFALSATASISEDKDVQAGIKLANVWIQTQLNYDNVPASSLAIVHDQEVIWSKGFGYANLEDKVAASPDTLYSICSVSKLFTSIGVMQQRDKGALSLDAPISQTLDWYKVGEDRKQEEAVSLRNILSHVAGLPREAVTPYWSEAKFPDKATLQTGTTEQQALYFPYQRFQYSNLGMSLAGESIEAVTDQSFHTYIKENILSPLGMNNTYSDLPVELYGKAFAKGYKLKDQQGNREDVGPYKTNAIAPAAGFASSVNDLAKFASWQFRLLENGGNEVLKATTLKEMQRVHWVSPDNKGPMWGLGFAVYDKNGKFYVGHGGYCPGYRTDFTMRMEDKIAVIGMVNVNDVGATKFTDAMYQLIAPSILSASQKSESTDNEDAEKADFSKYEGVYGIEGMPWRIAIAETSNGLKGVALFADKPWEWPLMLKHEEGHTFRVMSRDQKPMHTVRFEVNDKGEVTKYWQHGQYGNKLSEL